METLDGHCRQSVALPSMTHLDSSKIKREEMDFQRKRSASAMVSPLHPFSASPQHSYGNHQPSAASTIPGLLGGLLSPPESRRTSGDDNEPQRPPRQSLPSIHEALGAEQPLSYPAPPPSAPASAPQPFLTPSTTSSPSDSRLRNLSVDHVNNQGPPNPFSHPRSPYMGSSTSATTPTTATAPPLAPSQSRPDAVPRSSLSTTQHTPKLPTLHPLRTTQSPPPVSSQPQTPYSTYPPPTPSYESPAPQSAGPTNPQYAYQPYPSNYPLSASPPSGPNSRYPPAAAAYSAPPRYPTSSWREDGEFSRPDDKKPGRNTLAPYGESVKRHLESFDLEASLNEMAEGAGRVADFSKLYRQRAHENQRIGMTPQSMPRLEEVDEMMKQGDKIQLSLQRMREVVFNHQQANIVEPPRESHYRPINGYEQDSQIPFHEDAKGSGGFAGPDPKKRRGRAAPPGRCHSCNRAETPEWRRGPDGARTLCNACGLHYAKLTRKMGGKQAMTSSNLRPKSLGEGSPTA